MTFAVPAVLLAAMLLIVPIPLSILGFLVYGLAVCATRFVVALAIGHALLARTGREPKPLGALALGLALLSLLLMIPLLGILVRFLVVLAGLGALALHWRAARATEA